MMNQESSREPLELGHAMLLLEERSERRLVVDRRPPRRLGN